MKLKFFKIRLKSFKVIKQTAINRSVLSYKLSGRRSIIDREFDPGNNGYKVIGFHIGRLRT